jgi:two-component system, OmpR family, phosphate regulon response regulator PhoB
MARILIVDSHPADRARLLEQLRSVGHECVETATGDAALAEVDQRSVDLVLADWRLPDMSGLELATELRRRPGSLLSRILLVSARTDPQAAAAALDGGADDFLPKSCALPELLARVHAALRRPPSMTGGDVLEVGPIRLERQNHKVLVDSNPLPLAPAEFRLIAYFMEHPGRVLPRRQLLEQVWRSRHGIGERTVDVHVRRLRAALEPHQCDHLLQTVRGFGYRFG